ncbi:MAG TPA: hypothetical protein VFT82_02310 [Candidatus Paceibacterota bacterium]|nr:hypothetical protein [Candidatus Paceibacterota bacterium]
MKTQSFLLRALSVLVLLVIGFTPVYAGTPQPTVVDVSNRITLHANETTIFGIVVSSTQRVLVRAVGPELAKFGVPNVNADPTLTVFSGQTPIVTVDDWEDQPIVNGKPLTTAAAISAAFQATGAFPLDSGSTSAATMLTLAPGAYTIQVHGVGGLAGEVLIEVYTVPDSVPN